MEVLTVPDVARLLNLSEITVYRLAKEGKIPAKKVGRCWRFSKETIEKWFSHQATWEEEIETLLNEMKSFGRAKEITDDEIGKALREVRKNSA
ncbi:MAG: Helix-turn-helix domain protein [bacterium ADurb.Bin363]|nr:MAG: Helix-turn-helix domain protein [bacterium ADurb.Bin363]